MRVPVIAAAAISPWGAGWRGLGEALADGAAMPGLPADRPLASPKAQKMMSRGAYLAASCLGELMRGAAWRRAELGYFLGVGASGGSLDDVHALLAASISGGAFSLTRFGERGLAACNPLLAFQLMNNFTLCHGAILEGIGGPNAALFSRGAGTVAALIEAAHAVMGGDCAQAIAGGADSALHPVTRAELAREQFVARGLVPGEGAALVVLGVSRAEGQSDGPGTLGPPAASGVRARGGEPDGNGDVRVSDPSGAVGVRVEDGALSTTDLLGVLEGAAIASGEGRPLDEAIADAAVRAGAAEVDVVVIAPWGPPAAEALRGWARVHALGARVVDGAPLGEALAATPALAWVAALDLLAGGRCRRALVLSAGTDGDAGAVVLARGAA